jgi:hypothetical protein
MQCKKTLPEQVLGADDTGANAFANVPRLADVAPCNLAQTNGRKSHTASHAGRFLMNTISSYGQNTAQVMLKALR